MRVRILSVLAITAVLPGIAGAQDVPREQTADQQVRHVLNRLAFGPRPGDYEKVRAMGVDAWIDQQLHPERIADPAVTQLLAQLPTYSATPEQLEAEFPPPGQLQRQAANARTAQDSMMLQQERQEARRVVAELSTERVGRAVVSERQLEEVMVDFWLNHFSVFAGKNAQMRYYLTSYERDVIRPHAFGKFRDLLGAVAHSPAMLYYLDNWQSVADTGRRTAMPNPLAQGGRGRAALANRFGQFGRGGARGNAAAPVPPQQQQARRASGLNENYGRELLELHTLGVDGGYTQKDVTEVARALTGWSVQPPAVQAAQAARAERGGRGGRGGRAELPGTIVQGDFVFRPQVHDAEEKTVLGVKLKAGRGIEDGEQVLDIVAHHPSTAKFIATKLARRFVCDSPPASLVNRAAETFRKTDGDIREVLRTIFTSPEFFSAQAYRAKVKAPFEVVASAMRVVGAPADPTPRTAQLTNQLGQQIFGRQTPDGWPEVGEPWINTGSILNRINFGTLVAAGRVPGSNQQTWPLPLDIRRESRDKQVDAVINVFLGGEASADTRSVLMTGTNPFLQTAKVDSTDVQKAMNRMPPDTARITAMDPATLRQTLAGRAFQQLPALDGVPQLVGLALGSPEFQRR